MYKKLIDLNLLKDKSNYPIYAFLSISNICNANCIFCDVHENKCFKTCIDVYSILDQMKEIGIKYVHFTGGGEPFANKEIFDFMEHASKLGLNIIFLSNGIALNEEKIDKISQYNIKAIFFSLDSHLKEVHNEIRGVPGCFENLSKVINLCKNKMPNIPITINHVLSNRNLDYLKDFIDLKDEVGYDYLNPIIVKECPEYYFSKDQIKKFNQEKSEIMELAKNKNVEFLYDDINYFEENQYFDDGSDLRKNQVKCKIPNYTCFIDCVSGNVYPCDCCCHRDQEYYSYGSLKNNTLKQLFDANRFKEIQEELNGRCSLCKSKCDYANVEFNKFIGE